MAFPASSYDVLIIGGGPAGLYAASGLAASGRHVGVFEEHPEIGSPAHCTGLVALETFTRFTLPTPDTMTAFAGALLHSPGGQRLPVASPRPEALLLDRPAFDRALAAQAHAAGADLFTGYRVETVERQHERMNVRITGENGPRLVVGRLVLLATGASYRLHRGLGLPVPQRFVHGAQIEAAFEAATEVEVYFGNDVAPGSFAWVVPFTRQGAAMAKIGVLASRDASRYLTRFLSSPPIATRLRGPLHPYRARPIPVAPLVRTFSDRTMAIGDAAGLAKPTTGGGVYYSLLSAELAAATAHEALTAENGSARFLSRYHTVWRAALGPEIRAATLFRTFAASLSDTQIDEAFQVAAGEPVARLIRDHGCFNWHKRLILALCRNAPTRRFIWHALRQAGQTGVARLLHAASPG